MPESFTETTTESWFSRLGGSIKGVLFGIVLFVLSFVLLFWNEGRAVRTAKSLEEGAANVVSVSPEMVDSRYEGRLIHMTGTATTDEILADDALGVSANAIKLARNVEMYQWQENAHSETREKVGGSTETTTTYEYESVWSPRLIDSSSFKVPEDHTNPGTMPYENLTLTADVVKVGAFKLSAPQLAMLSNFQPLPVTGEVPDSIWDVATIHNGGYYIGDDPTYPAVGDVRIRYQVVEPGVVSLVARQVGDTFEAYQAEAGGSVLLLQTGTHPADAMFTVAQRSNTVLTWFLRVVGFFMMFFGLTSIFRPIAVFGDVVPIVGSLLGAGIGLFAGLLSAFLSLFTIAISWIVFRPLLGIILLVLAIAALFLLVRAAKKKRGPPPIPAGA
jgi:hypothetical protein